MLTKGRLDEIRKVVSEELGIKDEMYEKALSVYENIKTDIPKREKTFTDDFELVSGTVSTDIEGLKVRVQYYCRNFYSQDTIDTYGIENLTTGGSAYLDKRFIMCTVNFYALNGSACKQKALETIQHEIEHVFQEIKADKRIPNSNFYAKMRTDMESQDEVRRKVARLIYGCLKSEQEGFVNGLYSFCMVDDFTAGPYTYNNIDGSEAYKLYDELKKNFFELRKNPEMQKILSEYKWTVDDVGKKMKNFIHRIGRVLIKVNNDKNKLGWRL